MTPEQIADNIANEMIEDLQKLCDQLMQFHDRYMQYSGQFGRLVSDSKRKQVDQALAEFNQKIAPLAGEDE
jgi:hypothetical protein